MSYFSQRATWLSLVESPESHTQRDLSETLPQDYVPVANWVMSESSFEDEVEETTEGLLQLEVMCDLRHRLFFHHGEREFGPMLLRDTLRMARAQRDPEEAVSWYCRARQVAQTLAEQEGEAGPILSWIELDHLLAELQAARGMSESSAMFAREGLDIIKRNRFGSECEAKVTALAVRLFRLLGRER